MAEAHHAGAAAVTAPYGSWRSPIDIELVSGSAVALAEPSIDGDDVYWLEGRPIEGGRRTLLRHTPDGVTREVTPAPFNVAALNAAFASASPTTPGAFENSQEPIIVGQ